MPAGETRCMGRMAMALEAIRRILIIRLSSLGDIVLTTPILQLLRASCPAARIDFLLKAEYQDLLRAHPCVDRLLLWDKQQSAKAMIRTLRQTRYDVVLDLHRTLRSRLLYRMVRARRHLAYRKQTLRRALLVRLRWNTLQTMTPVPERYAAPLRRLGIQAPLPPTALVLDQESQDAIASRLARVLPDATARPLLAVAPGARWPTKRWPIEHFAQSAQELAVQHGATVVLVGDRSETPLSQALARRLSVPVIDYTGRLPLCQTAALIQRCQLLLCNDSGLMHVAVALRVPVVAIFGPTVQEFGFYPFRARAQVLSQPLACRPCSTKGSLHCPRGHHNCMTRITSAQVVEAAEAMW
jgi:lipopolysaccharide heptosyltransferase II